MKKLLIIIKKPMAMKTTRNNLVNEFVNSKKKEGYQIDIIGDTSGVMRDLLEENEVRAKEITSAQADVMFDLNRYEYAIYVPETANTNQDILVYNPDQLDKNMIFYHIGNLNIISRKALNHTREENKEALKGFTTDKGDYTDNIDKAFTAEGVIGDEYDKSGAERLEEIQGVFNEDKTQLAEQIARAEQDEVKAIQEKRDNISITEDYKADGCDIEPTEDALERTREDNKESLRGFTTDTGDYTDNIDKAFTAEGVIGDEYDKSGAERLEEIKDVFNQSEEEVKSQIASAEQGSVESIPKISLDEKVTVGEPAKKKDNFVDGPISSPSRGQEIAAIQENKLSLVRKIWLVLPWIVMALMGQLKYESIGLAVLVVSLLGLILAFLSKNQKQVPKTAEGVSLLLAAVATGVELANPAWIQRIAPMLGALGMILFVVIGNIKWED